MAYIDAAHASPADHLTTTTDGLSPSRSSEGPSASGADTFSMEDTPPQKPQPAPEMAEHILTAHEQKALAAQRLRAQQAGAALELTDAACASASWAAHARAFAQAAAATPYAVTGASDNPPVAAHAPQPGPPQQAFQQAYTFEPPLEQEKLNAFWSGNALGGGAGSPGRAGVAEAVWSGPCAASPPGSGGGRAGRRGATGARPGHALSAAAAGAHNGGIAGQLDAPLALRRSATMPGYSWDGGGVLGAPSDCHAPCAPARGLSMTAMVPTAGGSAGARRGGHTFKVRRSHGVRKSRPEDRAGCGAAGAYGGWVPAAATWAGPLPCVPHGGGQAHEYSAQQHGGFGCAAHGGALPAAAGALGGPAAQQPQQHATAFAASAATQAGLPSPSGCIHAGYSAGQPAGPGGQADADAELRQRAFLLDAFELDEILATSAQELTEGLLLDSAGPRAAGGVGLDEAGMACISELDFRDILMSSPQHAPPPGR